MTFFTIFCALVLFFNVPLVIVHFFLAALTLRSWLFFCVCFFFIFDGAFLENLIDEIMANLI